MESSRRDLFIDMVVDRFNFKNNQNYVLTLFLFIPTEGVRLPKTVLIFYCVSRLQPQVRTP